MSLYARTPQRRRAQITWDVVAVVWTAAWIAVAVVVHQAFADLADSLRSSVGGVNTLAQNLQGAADQAAQVPLVGEKLAAPIASAAASAASVGASGAQGADSLVTAGLWLGIILAAGPILLYWMGWLPARVRFARRSAAGQRYIDAGADPDMFALRALASQPLHVLAQVSANPVAAWRAGDRRVIEELADLELRHNGLRAPGASR